MNFGQLIRNKRLSQNKSLRDFSKDTGYDVAYISRLETSILLPPEEEDKLEKLVKSYGVISGSDEWQDFIDAASVSHRKIPEDINTKAASYLPAFFRKASKKEITKQDVDKLLELIKGEE